MITPKKLSEESVKLILDVLGDEYAAFYHYRAAGNYCKGAGYDIAAQFFFNESEDELKHAKDLETFLVDWNVTPELPEIVQPKLEFSSLLDCIETSYTMEYDLYEKYEKDGGKAMKMDLCVFNLLQDKIRTQNAAVAEYSDKLNMLEGVEPTKINFLLLENKLFS